MDPDFLRLILLGLGVVLVIGIYLVGQRERLFGRRAVQQRQDRADDQTVSDASLASVVPDHSVDPMLAPTVQASRDLPAMQAPSFAAAETPPASPAEDTAPQLIIQLQVATTSDPFQAEAVLEAAQLVGLVYDDQQQVYQRICETDQSVIFRMANLVKPGTLPGVADADFSTPGFVLFAVLPCTWDGLAVFSDLVATAERVASHLAADVLGEDRKPLSQQSLQFTRDLIVDHRRQVVLARSLR